MPRTQPSTDPISFREPTGHYYATPGGRRSPESRAAGLWPLPGVGPAGPCEGT